MSGGNGDRPSPDVLSTPGSSERLRLGGMALRNGLLIHGPTSWAVAARSDDGTIEVASGEKPRAPARLGSLPLLRGPIRLAEGFAFIPVARRRLPAARLPFENGRVLAAAAGVSAAAALLRRSGVPPALRESVAAAIGLIPALVALRDDDLAAYHGVEHKAIGGYEQGRDPVDVPKEHERCGSHLIAPLLLLSVCGQLVVQRLVERPGPAARGLAGAAAVSLAVELFAWSERNPGSAVARALRAPGTEIQRQLATREPSGDQMEVGSAALREVLRAEAANGS